MNNISKIKKALDAAFPTVEDKAEHFKTLKKDVFKKVNTVENKLNWIETFIKPLGLFCKISKNKNDLKLFSVEFDGSYPVPCGLVIVSESYSKAVIIAGQTITHTDKFTVKEVSLDVPSVVFYESGEYKYEI